MMKINRDAFFKGYRNHFGNLSQSLVDALNFLLGKLELDHRFDNSDLSRQQISYILATFKWETAHTMLPIDEYGSDAYFEKRYGSHTRVGKTLGNTQAGDGARYHGRGYVQLTGRRNYAKASVHTGQDLLGHPDRCKDPELAYDIAVQGMLEGWFTGRRLNQYFKPALPPDYTEARRIINGTDKAVLIAELARAFEQVLAAAISKKPLMA